MNDIKTEFKVKDYLKETLSLITKNKILIKIWWYEVAIKNKHSLDLTQVWGT